MVGEGLRTRRVVMMTSVNTHRSTNRTLAVIDGGLNVEEGINAAEAEIARPSPPSHPRAALQLHDRENLRGLDQEVYLFPRQAAPRRNGRARSCKVSFQPRY